MVRDKKRVVVRGGGDVATGVIQKLWRAGLSVVVLETAAPTAIRRTVALSEAVYLGEARVEDITCRLVGDVGAALACLREGIVPMLIDPNGATSGELAPDALVDAILAKRNLGTHRGMAAVTVGLGPGFRAGEDVDAVIETMRGHTLGRLILEGCALPDTGVPGEIAGRSAERVLRAPAAGRLLCHRHIGDSVSEGEALFSVGTSTVYAPFAGLLRGMLREGTDVPEGMKTADIDPRADAECTTVSDKARCIGGAALEAVLYLLARAGRASCV